MLLINQSINNNNSLKTKYQCLLFQIEVAEIKKICSWKLLIAVAF
jgi:hypothetical protein